MNKFVRVTSRSDSIPSAHKQLIEMVTSGELNVHHESIEGLENAPDAIGRLYNGNNTGRLIVRP